MTSAEDQYKKPLALYQLASKDYNKALLDEVMYNAQTSFVKVVSEIHNENVKEMLLQKEEAKRDFDRCKRRREKLLGIEMAAEEIKVGEEKVKEEKVVEEVVVEVGSSSDSSSSSSSSTLSHADSNSDKEDEEEEQDWTESSADADVSELVSDLKNIVKPIRRDFSN